MAWGAVNRRGVWVAEWRDGYGKGTWTLDLTSDGSFGGRQVVDAYAPEAEDLTATIAGEWAGAAKALDCDAIRQQVRGATAP